MELVSSPKIAKIKALAGAIVLCEEIGLNYVIFEWYDKFVNEEVNAIEDCWAPHGQLTFMY